MKNAKQTLVLFQSSSTRNKICADLNKYESITYRYAESMTQLHDLIDQDQIPLIFVQAPQLPLSLTVANLRTLVGLGSLIVVTDISLPNQLSEILLAGADVVVENTLTHTELLAWISVLLRRAEGFMRTQKTSTDAAVSTALAAPVAASPLRAEAKPWRLIDGGWRLLSPGGESCNLTSSERFFLESFVGQIDKRVSREELLGNNANLNENSRAIDSLISRLRRKVQLKNAYLPIKAVHGWGYSFTELLLSEGVDVGQVPEPLATEIEPAFILELRTKAQFEQQLQEERFEFMFNPVLDTTNNSVVGAFAVLVWKDQMGQQTRIEHLVPHLQSLNALDSLVSWGILKLNHELKAWEEQYDAHIPIYIDMSAEMLIQKYSQIDKYAPSDMADKLTIIVKGLSHTVDLNGLQSLISKLQKKGIAVWARYENEDLLGLLHSRLDFDGISFWRLTDNLIRGQASQDLSHILEVVRQKKWPTLVVDVDDIEQRRFTEFLDIRYVAGNMVAIELSRDGLLLSWASRQ